MLTVLAATLLLVQAAPPAGPALEGCEELLRNEPHGFKQLTVDPTSPVQQEKERAIDAERAAVKAGLGKAAEIEWIRHAGASYEYMYLVVLPRSEGARKLTCGERSPGSGCAQVLPLLAAQAWRPGAAPGTSIVRADEEPWRSGVRDQKEPLAPRRTIEWG